LVEYPETASFLELSEEQAEVIQPKIAMIRKFTDDYSKEKEELEAELGDVRNRVRQRRQMRDRSSGEEGDRGSGIRERLQNLRDKRQRYQNSINVCVEEIKRELNEEQLAKFEKLQLPELEDIEMPERGERPRGRGRGTGGGGRGGRGGRGGSMMF
jgi:molybdopterin converting factor small subunit